MKKTLFTLLLLMIASGAIAQSAFLDVGDTVSVYPKVVWLKGQSMTHFEKDKIYIVELWATWCMPCLAAMPHLNALSRKFNDKKVIVIGQDVMEDDQNKVEHFLEKEGDGMSFPVAFGGGSGSDFTLKWLKPAGVFAIPQTFVIQNNILVWQTNPENINDEVVQLLVDGKFTIDAAEKINKAGKP